MLVPVYGFLEGDTIGLLILAKETDTVETVITKLQDAASIRVDVLGNARLVHRGRVLRPESTVQECRIEALDRIDVITGPIEPEAQDELH